MEGSVWSSVALCLLLSNLLRVSISLRLIEPVGTAKSHDDHELVPIKCVQQTADDTRTSPAARTRSEVIRTFDPWALALSLSKQCQGAVHSAGFGILGSPMSKGRISRGSTRSIFPHGIYHGQYSLFPAIPLARQDLPLGGGCVHNHAQG